MKFYQKVWRKMNRQIKKHKIGRNLHHFLRPKSRGGDNSLNNLLLIDIEKHQCWHKLFKNATAEEVLNLLERVVRAKKHQGVRNENTVLHPRTLQGVWEDDVAQSSPRKTHRVIRESHLEDLQ